MSTFCIPFDPSAQPSGTLDTKQGSGGTLWVFNDSAVNVLFTLSDGSEKFCPAGAPRKIELGSLDSSIAWKQQAILPLTVPNSQLYGESYAPSEEVPDAFLGPIVRGQVVTGSIVAQQLIDIGTVLQTMFEASFVTAAGNIVSTMDTSSQWSIETLSNGLILPWIRSTNGGALSGHAVLILGNASDPSMLTFIGNLDKIRADTLFITSDGNGNLAALTHDVVNASAATLPSTAHEGGVAYDGTIPATIIFSEQQGGATTGIIFTTWNGAATKELLSLGSGIGSASVNIDNSGDVNASGWYAGGQGNAGAITTGATLSVSGIASTRCSPAGAVTGIILAAGSVRDQEFTVINEAVAANTITFAASGSRVSDGSSDVIAGLHARKFKWDAGTSLWYPCI